MTFVPTPKIDLPTLEQLHEEQSWIDQALFSYLHWQRDTNAGVLASISDLYQRLGGRIASGSWLWADDAEAIGTFHVAFAAGENERIIYLSRHDADSNPITLGGFGPGRYMVLMDDPSYPPVTAFRQYVAVSPLQDHGEWWQFNAVRVATFGLQDIPSDGTRISLLFG